ncbi:VIT1/CCC1 transporter family protein [Niveibacterium terrae]|uniref:VIT1/CCC1 transporter family protein n=1 Tax=Niveibacterium terrae TaxID=3373598 RepID=UPI003A90F60A
MRGVHHIETHKSQRNGWLRAAVLGANDGILSTASLILGVAASGADQRSLLAAGLASLVAGAMSMAAGEFVSVSTQADTESADLDRERKELKADPVHEQAEMAAIYVERGLDADLAARVAQALMTHDALGAHARDELGIFGPYTARPVQAALSSAGSFALGALLPLLLTVLSPATARMWMVPGGSILSLALLGLLSAHAGGAPRLPAATRIVGWGALAMALTAAAGALFGAA